VWSGWEGLGRAFVTRAEPHLRAGVRGGCRRALLAALLWHTRGHWIFFYTVQAPEDEKRLWGRGLPWPTEDIRAHFGPGVYAWKNASDARSYRRMLLHQMPHLRILRFMVLGRRLQSLPTIDVDAQPDPDVWMRQYSLLGTARPLPHGAKYIRRHTGLPRGDDTAVEHYFARSVLPHLLFFRWGIHGD